MSWSGLNGMLAGSPYALMTLAVVVVSKASRMLNVALGERVMFAARLATAGLHGLGLGLVGVLGVGCAGMVALALAFNRLVLRHVGGSPVIALLMVTIGLGTVWHASAFFLLQGLPAGLPVPLPRNPRAIQGMRLSVDTLVAAGIAFRAMADDQQAAMLVGIASHRSVALTWALLGLLCAVGGECWGRMRRGTGGAQRLADCAHRRGGQVSPAPDSARWS